MNPNELLQFCVGLIPYAIIVFGVLTLTAWYFLEVELREYAAENDDDTLDDG